MVSNCAYHGESGSLSPVGAKWRAGGAKAALQAGQGNNTLWLVTGLHTSGKVVLLLQSIQLQLSLTLSDRMCRLPHGASFLAWCHYLKLSART
jgi:hypothetical protein